MKKDYRYTKCMLHTVIQANSLLLHHLAFIFAKTFWSWRWHPELWTWTMLWVTTRKTMFFFIDIDSTAFITDKHGWRDGSEGGRSCRRIMSPVRYGHREEARGRAAESKESLRLHVADNPFKRPCKHTQNPKKKKMLMQISSINVCFMSNKYLNTNGAATQTI